MTYKQIHVRFDDSSGTGFRTLYSPPVGNSGLIQCCRAKVVLANVDAYPSGLTLDLELDAGSGSDSIIAEIPIMSGNGSVIYDIMPFLSNLASYGISNPDSFKVRTNQSLLTGDLIRMWGFVIEGADV